jgi:hypothetical protein
MWTVWMSVVFSSVSRRRQLRVTASTGSPSACTLPVPAVAQIRLIRHCHSAATRWSLRSLSGAETHRQSPYGPSPRLQTPLAYLAPETSLTVGQECRFD